LNGFSNSQKASITQHGPRTACAGCIESQNGGIFFAALQAKSEYKTGYWEHLRALICVVKQPPGVQAPGGSGEKPSVEAVQLKKYFENRKSGS